MKKIIIFIFFVYGCEKVIDPEICSSAVEIVCVGLKSTPLCEISLKNKNRISMHKLVMKGDCICGQVINKRSFAGYAIYPEQYCKDK